MKNRKQGENREGTDKGIRLINPELVPVDPFPPSVETVRGQSGTTLSTLQDNEVPIYELQGPPDLFIFTSFISLRMTTLGT